MNKEIGNPSIIGTIATIIDEICETIINEIIASLNVILATVR